MPMNTTQTAGYAPHPLTTPPATRPSGASAKVTLRAAAPDAVLAVVPHLLGFHPSRSLVVLGLGDEDRVIVTFRYDLPQPDDQALAADIARHAGHVLTRERLTGAILIGYGPAELTERVLAQAAVRLAGHGIAVHEVLRTEAGRYWTVLCGYSPCCPPEGHRFDAAAHPAAVALTETGVTVLPDRQALARTLARPPGSAREVARATRQARLLTDRLAEYGKSAGDADPQLRVIRAGRTQVQRAIRLYRGGGTIAGTAQLAWLAVLLSGMAVRDDAWARMLPDYAAEHGRLWTDVLRSTTTEFVPAPASLLAFTAWQQGSGALASIAVDRALAADPDYSMARLLADALQGGLPPSSAKLPMRPAAVAASYAPSGTRVGRARPGPRPRRRRSARTAPRREPAPV